MKDLLYQIEVLLVLLWGILVNTAIDVLYCLR